ncbi:MAG: hypothetical protein GX610_16450 [Rhodococcus sp.]|nr:hypothetical protein [Rhodococcus sp. (in: high G+C Gram-positive bacteria)]
MDATLETGATNDPVSSQLEGPDGAAITPLLVELSSARPATVGEQYDVAGVLLGRRFTEEGLVSLAVASDGTLVVAELPPPDVEAGVMMTAPVRVGSWDWQQFTPYEDVSATPQGDGPRQAYGGYESDGYVTWVETESVDLFVDTWRVFLRHPDGHVALLARGEEINPEGVPFRNELTQPVISGGRVFWMTPYPTAPSPDLLGDEWTTAIVSRDVDGSEELRVDAVDARSPSSSRGGVIITRTTPAPGADENRDLVSWIDGAGETHDLVSYSSDGQLSITVSASDELAVVRAVDRATDAGPAWLDVIDLESLQTTRISLDVREGSMPGNEVHACGGLVVWNNADGAGTPDGAVWAFDSRADTLWTVAVPELRGPMLCHDRLIAWDSFPDPDPGVAATLTLTRWN